MSRDLLMPSTRAFGTPSDNALKASLRKMREEREAKAFKGDPAIVRRTSCEYCGDKYSRSVMVKTDTGYLCKECLGKVNPVKEPVENIPPAELEEIPQESEPAKDTRTRRTRCYRCETLFNRDELTKGKDDGLYCEGCMKTIKSGEGIIDHTTAEIPPIARVSPEFVAQCAAITSMSEPRRCFYCGGAAFEILKDGTCRCVDKGCGAVYKIDKPMGGK